MKKKLFCLIAVLALVFSSAAVSEAQLPSADPEYRATPEKCRIVGEHVTFGTYPQTEDGTDRTPIEWEVMDYDEENGKALLLSFYGLDQVPYNREQVPVTWETCTLRAWLNDEFLNTAFTPEEQAAILTTDVGNSREDSYGWSTPSGNDTQDRIFLLSYAEANKYLQVQFGVKHRTVSRMTPTNYAHAKGSYIYREFRTTDGSKTAWWFLRSPGCYRYTAALVGIDGSLYHTYVDSPTGAIRPAFWLDLNADCFSEAE